MQLHSLDGLRCFLAAARVLNFSNASKSVGLTPAAFGQRLKQLEQQLGAPLFVRSTRKVHITETGIRMLPWAERCVAAADDCVRAALGNDELPSLQITIGIRHELGTSWLVPRFDELETMRPGLELHLHVGTDGDLLRSTRALEIDCAIVSSQVSDARLEAFRLHRQDHVFCASRALLEKVPLARPLHAGAHTLFDISDDLPLFRHFRDAPRGWDRLAFGRFVRLGGTDMVRQRVLAGKGVAVLPQYLVEQDLHEERLMRVFPSVKLLHDDLQLACRKQDPRRPFFERFAKRLSEAPLR